MERKEKEIKRDKVEREIGRYREILREREKKREKKIYIYIYIYTYIYIYIEREREGEREATIFLPIRNGQHYRHPTC